VGTLRSLARRALQFQCQYRKRRRTWVLKPCIPWLWTVIWLLPLLCLKTIIIVNIVMRGFPSSLRPSIRYVSAEKEICEFVDVFSESTSSIYDTFFYCRSGLVAYLNKNESRLTRSPSYRCVCVSSYPPPNFWMAEQIIMKSSMYNSTTPEPAQRRTF
jgi:hypothetical protein